MGSKHGAPGSPERRAYEASLPTHVNGELISSLSRMRALQAARHVYRDLNTAKYGPQTDESREALSQLRLMHAALQRHISHLHLEEKAGRPLFPKAQQPEVWGAR